MDSMIKHYPYQVSYIKPNGSPMKMEFVSEDKAQAFVEVKKRRGCTNIVLEHGNFMVEEYGV